jgi:hypothetical protein
MTYRWNKIAQLAAIGACCSLAVWISSTNAKDGETSVLVKKAPAATVQDGPALPPPSNPNATAPAAKPNSTTDLFAPRLSTPTVKPKSQAGPTIPPQQPRTTAKQPFMRPAVPREPAQGRLTAGAEPMPAPANAPPANAPPETRTTDVNVKPTPPIVYDTDHDARKMYRAGQVELVMVTQDPADGCCYEIPLCIPACCTGDPKVSSGRGIFGRGVVEYCWSCGFRAKVKFRHTLGDVRVDYEGD